MQALKKFVYLKRDTAERVDEISQGKFYIYTYNYMYVFFYFGVIVAIVNIFSIIIVLKKWNWWNYGRYLCDDLYVLGDPLH